jgi:hypothetical protein
MESGNTAQTVPTELYPLPGLFVVLMEMPVSFIPMSQITFAYFFQTHREKISWKTKKSQFKGGCLGTLVVVTPPWSWSRQATEHWSP